MGKTKIKPVCSQNQLAFTKGTRKCFWKLSLHHEHHDVTSHISYVDSRQDKNSWMPWVPSLVRSPRRCWFLRKTKGSDKQSRKYKQTDNFLSKGNTEKRPESNPPLKNPSTGNVISWDDLDTLTQCLHLQSTAQFRAPTARIYEHNPVICL